MSVIANLIPYKGHRDLVDALAQAAPHLPAGWRLLVVGRDDGVGETLREQARHLGLADHILFMGPRGEVAEILAASDIGILCSHEEGFSNAVLEGMAAGLPMIVTRVGGNTEAVIDGETGIVVPPRAPTDLAAAIVRLVADPGLRARFGAAGRQRVQKEFGVDRFVQAHCALYRGLQAGRSPADIPELVVAA
jgi:glycosyltransferase involved in cell wall biosynthesis